MLGEKKPYPITDEVRLQRSDASMKHGLRSERRIKPLARSKKRAFLRRNGLLASALDGPTLAHLNRWARMEAMADLAQRYLDEHGLIRDDGEPQPVLRYLVAVENGGRLAMKALEEALRSRKVEGDSLESYIRQNYGGDEDEDEDAPV